MLLRDILGRMLHVFFPTSTDLLESSQVNEDFFEVEGMSNIRRD